jgi:hypothetical protein
MRHLRSSVAGLAAVAVAAAAPSAASAGGSRPFNVSASAKLVPSQGAALVATGSFSGTPLGRGQARIATRLGQGNGASFTFTFTTARGSVSGSGNLSLKLHGSHADYRGTANVTAGTGAFRTLRARRLTATGAGTVPGGPYKLHLVGRATF